MQYAIFEVGAPRGQPPVAVFDNRLDAEQAVADYPPDTVTIGLINPNPGEVYPGTVELHLPTQPEA